MIESEESELLIRETPVNQSHWIHRAFSKMEKDSLRGATFVLISSALGTGILTLHHFFNSVGIIWGVLLMIMV